MQSFGTNISIPPNIAHAPITVSFSNFASLKSNLTEPKIAFKFAFSKFSPALFTFCSPNAAKIFSVSLLSKHFVFSLTLKSTLLPNIKNNPINTTITGNRISHRISNSNNPWAAKRSKTPIIKNIKEDILLLPFSKKDMALGTIINNVHHPSKKIFMSATPVLLSPQITPININTIPHNILLKFFM